MNIEIKETKDINKSDVIEIYKANKWSSAQKPNELFNALLNSHSLITAWHNENLVGIGNAISDGYLVVYYPHLIIHPNYHGKGIGKSILRKFQEKYGHFHQQILVADGGAIDFYKNADLKKPVKLNQCGYIMAVTIRFTY